MRRRSERKAKASEESPGKSARKTRHSEPLEVQVQDIELPTGEKSPTSVGNNEIEDVAESKSDQSGKNKPTEPIVSEETGQTSDDSSLWKVQSSNGGNDGGEIKKLKICRQKPTESPEIAETSLRKRLSRGVKDGRSTDDSTHEESEKESKRKHRSRTSSKNSPLVSPTVVCDSDRSPTKIKIINVSNVNVDKTTASEKAEDILTTSIKVELKQEEEQRNNVSEIALPTMEVESKKPDVETGAKEESQELGPTAEPNQTPDEPEEKRNDTKAQISPSRDRSSSSDSDSYDRSSKPKKSKKRQSTVHLMVNSTVNVKKESSDSEETSRKISADRRDSTDTKEANNEDADNKENQEESQHTKMEEDTKPEESNNEEVYRPLIRKRRWGSSKAKRPSDKLILQISTNTLKNLIPDVKPVAPDELQLSIEEDEEGQLNEEEEDDDDVVVMVAKEEEAQLEQERQKEERQKDKDLEEKKKRIERKERFDKAKKEAKTTDVSAARKVKIVSEDEKKVTRHPSPSRQKTNSVLFITHLVRPFTVQQLKNLLLRTGTIVENGFWIDKIKSKCYVEYANEDMAVETRHALHGVRWPTSNPKTLVVEFATRDDLQVAQAICEEEDVPRKTEPLDMVEGWVAEQARMKDRSKRIVREWDVGKPEHPDEALLEYELKIKEKEKRELERKARKERHHRSTTPEAQPSRKNRRKEEEAPAKLLDDLFRKTKASPCIYWLPLTPEQIAVKEEMRRQHMAEHERRMAEIKKADVARRERERRSRK